ncbi:hypothetical protein FACS1894171_0950 [Clostridia bacterium]|nr:hypothetical protein FACS1894171_0950 [Clostridia bacterium]
MLFELNNINRSAAEDPEGFAARCDEEYAVRISDAATVIAGNVGSSPIVLLSGPSGSGKTTTALKLTQELLARGIGTHTVSLDNYFIDVDINTHPRDENGNIDYESPQCLDIDLLARHFAELARGDEVAIPKFEFTRQRRNEERARRLCLGSNEIAIFEGIHALNDMITSEIGNRAQKLYVSARTSIEDGGKVVFKHTWTRLLRRIIRDYNFRGWDAAHTLAMWGTVRRGEKRYISPFKFKADIVLDSALEYEVSVLAPYAVPMLAEVPECERNQELLQILPAVQKFAVIDQQYVGEHSLIREFIGGGSYSYS